MHIKCRILKFLSKNFAAKLQKEKINQLKTSLTSRPNKMFVGKSI